MFELSKSFRFEAAHMLPHHNGKCARLHGHSWVAIVTVARGSLTKSGSQTNMAVDFGLLKGIVQPLVDKYLDHYLLNESLREESPTSEFVARWLYDNLVDRFQGETLHLDSITVEETCTSRVTYRQ